MLHTALVYLNSSLNPLIYSWKMSHIRKAIMEIGNTKEHYDMTMHLHTSDKKKLKKKQTQ